MNWRPALALLAALAVAFPTVADNTEPKDLPREDAVSGLEFVTAETRALQADDFANPGLLWVDRGRAFFEQADHTVLAVVAGFTNDLTLTHAADRFGQQR